MNGETDHARQFGCFDFYKLTLGCSAGSAAFIRMASQTIGVRIATGAIVWLLTALILFVPIHRIARRIYSTAEPSVNGLRWALIFDLSASTAFALAVGIGTKALLR